MTDPITPAPAPGASSATDAPAAPAATAAPATTPPTPAAKPAATPKPAPAQEAKEELVRVKCMLDNASEEINGVKFQAAAGKGRASGYMLSDPIPRSVAETFAAIPGYSIV